MDQNLSNTQYQKGSVSVQRRNKSKHSSSRVTALDNRNHENKSYNQMSSGGHYTGSAQARKVHFDHIEMTAQNVDEQTALAEFGRLGGFGLGGACQSGSKLQVAVMAKKNARSAAKRIVNDDGRGGSFRRKGSCERESMSLVISDGGGNKNRLSCDSQGDGHSGESVSQRSCFSYRSSRYSNNTSNNVGGQGGKRRKRRKKRRSSVHNNKELDKIESGTKPARVINMTGSLKELPAGRPYNEPKQRRKLQMESNAQLKTIVCDINGRVPTFGYPLINYSPKQNTVSLTDA